MPILCPSKFLLVVRFASISHLIHRRICMSGSHVIAPDIALAVSHSYPRRPASRVQTAKLLRSAAALPSLRMPPVGHQRHCHAVWTMVTFSSTPSAKHLGQSPSWRSPEAFSCNTPCSRPVQSNCALALIPVIRWTSTLTSSRI